MNIRISKKRNAAYALVVVIIFAAVGLATLAGALNWTSTGAILTERNNTYYKAQAAAEAATEKVIARISRDYLQYGEAAVYSSMSAYSLLVPNSGENAYWQNISFNNAQGAEDHTYISRLSSWGYTNLASQYTGLKGMASTYRIISNARVGNVTAAVKQEVQVASIPIFQFAIFYAMDLEINPGPVMKITGRVHSNAKIYTQPVNSLTYMDHVTAAGDIILKQSPLDPSSRSKGTVTFNGEHDSKVSALSLPIGTNNSPDAVRAVVEQPPVTEDKNSAMGKQRYYNKADMVVTVSGSGVQVKSGAFNSFATAIPWNQAKTFISTNASFYNKREGKTVNVVDIDVGQLKTWAQTNTVLRNQLGRDLNSIYVDDMRTQPSSAQPGVRLLNGQTLPSLGLTVATPDPLYVKGNYNAPSAHLGTTNTSLTKPASLIGDSITVLSTAWSDSNSSKSLGNRDAADTTVNAAFLGGIVPSDGDDYSGGVENFPRFLEDWNGRKFTYNGSMVVMFYSKISKAVWGKSDVYNAPNRNWAFDLNFMDATKLPPGTPQLLTLIRGAWKVLPPNTIM